MDLMHSRTGLGPVTSSAVTHVRSEHVGFCMHQQPMFFLDWSLLNECIDEKNERATAWRRTKLSVRCFTSVLW